MLARDEIRASLTIACKLLLLALRVIPLRRKICPLLERQVKWTVQPLKQVQ
jgi:hypothetical protein